MWRPPLRAALTTLVTVTAITANGATAAEAAQSEMMAASDRSVAFTVDGSTA